MMSPNKMAKIYSELTKIMARSLTSKE